MRTLQSLYCGLALSLAWAAAAQAQTAEPGTEPASVTKKDAVSTTATKGKPGDESAGELEEIVVTGTLIRGASAVGAPVIELDRKDIEATGAKTSADLFATLPQMQSFNSLPTGTPDQSEPIPRTNLRGFALSGSQATLVLLNGHRMVGAGVLQTSPDPSSIPIAAIERVEVLADGASAIYGADAVAGVVNIILRKDYDGAETHLDYGVADSYSQYSASQLLGTQWDTGSIMGVVEYTNHDNFRRQDRSYYITDLSPYGGANRATSSCPQPTVVVGTTSYAYPGLQPGTQNSCDPALATDLYPQQDRLGLVINGHQKVGDRTELYLEAYYSKSNQDAEQGSPFTSFTMTDANPYFVAPPGTGATSETVNYQFANEFGPSMTTELEFLSTGGTFGATFDVGHEWQADVNATVGYGYSNSLAPSLDNAVLADAIAATDPLEALDPFTGQTSPQVIKALGSGGQYFSGTQRLQAGEIKFDGPIFNLGGGAARLAVGVQAQHESIDVTNLALSASGPVDGQLGSEASRDNRAGFAEVYLPFVSAKNALPGVYDLTLSAAIRYDDYSDAGNTTNPRFALNYAPMQGLTFHATYSTSFQAPSLADTVGGASALVGLPVAPFTPTGFQPVPEIVIAGGTPGLKPTTAETWTAGLTFEPVSLPGFSSSVTYWRVDQQDEINLAFPTRFPTFTHPAFAQFWWGPGGNPVTQELLDSLHEQVPVTFQLSGQEFDQSVIDNGYIIDLRRKNIGGEIFSGIDFDFTYVHELSRGTLTAQLGGTYMISREATPAPGTPAIDQTSQSPRFTGRLMVLWNSGQWNAGAFLNYTGTYDAAGTDVTPDLYPVSKFLTTDLQLGYTFDTQGLLENLRMNLDVHNAFDEEPPFVLTTGGFAIGSNGTIASPLGRFIMLGITKKWGGK